VSHRFGIRTRKAARSATKWSGETNEPSHSAIEKRGNVFEGFVAPNQSFGRWTFNKVRRQRTRLKQCLFDRRNETCKRMNIGGRFGHGQGQKPFGFRFERRLCQYG